ncbi:MAG: type IV pilus twitching motility protein PilT [Polyangiales bacterium]
MARIDSFLRLVVEQNASDLHFHTGNPPMVRFQGDLLVLPYRVLSPEDGKRFLYEILTPSQRETFERELELDFAYVVEDAGRFRVNVFMQTHGIGAVFRVIPDEVPSLESLNLPSVLRKLCAQQNGLVLLTGPTGCGKSTTLAAMIHEINATSRRHILTIEDPIEFVHPSLKSVVTQRQVGVHALSFAAAQRAALREAPDVMVIGEMRDYETVSLALSAAETGVLVFGTLHANSASKAVDRVLSVCPEDTRDAVRAVLSVLLRGVLAQHLVKRITGDGRVAAIEVLLQNYGVSNMIRENKVHQLESMLRGADAGASGMQSLDAALFSLVRGGLVSQDEALRFATQPEELRKRMPELTEEV